MRQVSPHQSADKPRKRLASRVVVGVSILPFVQAAHAQPLPAEIYLPSIMAVNPHLLSLLELKAERNRIATEVSGWSFSSTREFDDEHLSVNFSPTGPEAIAPRFIENDAVATFGVGQNIANSIETAETESEREAVDVEPEAETAPPRLNPTGRDISLSAPMRNGEFLLNEVAFILGADDAVRIESKSLLAALRSLLSPDDFAALEASIAGMPYVPAAQLEPQGFIISYDAATIGLNIEIPPAKRAERNLSLMRSAQSSSIQQIEPANLSAYINFRSFADYLWNGAAKGLSAPTSLIDSAVRFKGIVLENEATLNFDSNTQNTFVREGTRLVYDDRQRLIRFSAGDLRTNGRGFSGSPQIAGLSAMRVYSTVDPLRNVQPRGDQSFVLTRPGTLEALINGRPVRKIRLDPGTYNVRDFPFVQGTNDVQFNIEDDAGGIQSIRFSQFFDRTLLAPGLTEFSLSAGIFAPFVGSSRDYQTGEPAAAGWFRRGISDSVTLGGNFNARKDGLTAGAESVLATRFGTLGLDAAVSSIKGIGSGYAFDLGFQKSFGGFETGARSVSLAANYRSPKFSNPGSLFVDNRIAWTLSASYAQPLGSSQYISVNGNYSIARGSFQNETSARLTYGRTISQRLNLTIDATYEDRSFFGREYGVRATLLVKLGPRSTGVAEVDSRTKRARLGYQTSRGEGVGSWGLSADVDVGEDDVGFNGGVNYTANRAELSLNHTTVYDFSGTSTDSQRTSARFGTALVFADGRFGVSRPIFDSFTMVAPHESLKGASVLIDPREGHYTAKSGTFGAAVDPDLAAYIGRTVTYDVPDAPIGYDLGAGSARVEPPYKGGYLIVAGSDYSVTAVGTLLGPDGSPISLLAGRATEQGVSDPKSLTVFTNRTGRFGISGLRPGKWLIEMPTEPPTEVEIVIPDGEKGIVRLGETTLGEIE